MAFESLTEKFQKVFRNLRGKGKLSETDVKAALKEVRMALLEADVNFKVVKTFIKSIEERAVGSEVLESLTPGQQVIKIVNDELVKLMGGEAATLSTKPLPEMTVIMMAGLQGAGKTTTAAKLAGKFRSQGMQPLLVGCDIYRPAAIEQLRKNAEKQQVELFEQGTDKKPADIVEAAIEYAKANGKNLVIIDTAGRLHIDEDMMEELRSIKDRTDIDYTLLTVDAMTGQDAVNVAQEFSDKVGIDGVILTKLDGDTRGGSALSIRAVTGKPIFYAGMGEKLSDLEVFHPERMAGRILGMGDVLSLIEKAEADFDAKKAAELAQKMRKSQFDYNDYLDQMQQIKKMGGVNSILSMMPGMAGGLGGGKLPTEIDERQLDRTEAIIRSMTKKERENPDLMNMSRKQRIARGAGVSIAEVNRFVKQFDGMKKMQKQLTGMMKNNKFNKLLGGINKWQ